MNERAGQRDRGRGNESARKGQRGRERETVRERPALDQSPLSVAPSSMRQPSRNVTSVAYVETRLSGDVGRKSSRAELIIYEADGYYCTTLRGETHVIQRRFFACVRARVHGVNVACTLTRGSSSERGITRNTRREARARETIGESR